MNPLFALALVLAVTTTVYHTFVEGCGGGRSHVSHSRVFPSGGGPSPTHGGWGAWIPHGWPHNPCSGPSNTASRHCNNPPPQHGGRGCSGPSTATVDCNECRYNNGECDHRCVNIDGGKRCECHPGYKRNPEDSNRCIAITCDASNWPTPSNGNSSCSGLSKVKSGTICTVTCNRGYRIAGSPSSRCDNDGRWYPNATSNCQVKGCTPLSPPDKGDITPEICKTNPLHGQKCAYKCSQGYKRVGPVSSTCDNGDWTQVGFYCLDSQAPSFGKTCPKPRTVFADKGKTTATVTWAPIRATDNDPTHINVTARPDVTSPHEFPEGSHTVIYTAKDPSQNTKFCFFTVNVQVLRCPFFIPPENGRLTSTVCGNVFGSVCRLQCNKGYILKGSIARTCDKVPGTNEVRWAGAATVCEANECPSLDTPDHAVKTGYGCSNPTSSYGTSCFLNCMLGYKAVGGSRQRTCQENQQWSGTHLQCQAVTCHATAVKSEGLLVNPPICANSRAILDYKKECRFTCKRGYQLQGPGLKTCAQSEDWVPMGNPYCLDVLGPTFTNCPPDREVIADRGTMSATVMWSPPKATDNSGFIPNVTHPRKGPGEKFLAGKHTIRYRATDKAGNIGECNFNILVTVVRCVPRLFAPTGGTKLCTKDNMYGSECSFTCHVGYSMVGSAKRVCEKNLDSSTGFWTENEAKCELVRCPLLQPPPQSVKSGCGAGSMHNVFGDKCLLYCDIGYRQISGSTQRICQADGTWSGQALQCEVVRCQALPGPDNGQVTPNSCKVSPEYGTACHFSCRKGHMLIGAPVVSCIRDGKWSQNTRRFCKDVESPSFGVTCPSDIRRFADRGKNYTTVNWNPVIATDNSGVRPNVDTSGVKSKYDKGKHVVMYKASDEAGNSKICKFHVSVLVLRCQRLPPPLNGFLVGQCDDSYGSRCRISCDDGYNLVGAKDITCEAKPGHIIGYWDKPMPICNVRKCSPLKAPIFGSVYPHMCTSSPISGTTCYFQCSHGFKDDGGVNATHCGKDGEWTRDESEILKCVDVTPPQFLSCPSDIRTSISVNSSALVNWKVPVAMDNSNIAPQITVSPQGVIPPYKFLNSTLVVYTAKDSSGNEEECSFKILLEDNLGPEVVYCPPDQNVSVTKMKSVIRWKSPQFKDNSNSPLVESCSHQSGTKFYWGTWNVLCTAYDKNPNNKPAVCRFTLRLKPKDCKDLPPPKNGAKACDDWALGRMCSPFCNDQWDFTQRLPPFTIWSCGASGRWFPPMRWPDCTRVYQPNKARMAMDLYYYNGDCTSPKAQAQIKQNFIKILVGSIYRQICQDDVYKDKCKADNVKVTCALVPSVTDRKKRSLDDANLVHNGTQRSLIPQTTISLDVVVLLEGSETDDTKEDKVNAGQMGVKIANNIKKEIKKAVDEGGLSLNVNGTEFAADKESLNISEPERLCATGQAYRDGYCVSCSPGTYLNKTLGTCEDCPVGTYQDKESQETCLLCPPKTSTEDTRTYNRSGCIAMCKLGSYSPTGLTPCIPCEKGFFQEMEGQRLCLKCSLGTTTSKEGSSSSKQCGVPCPAGSFSPTGLAPCSLCSQRSFQPHDESRACVPCPGTTVTDQPGSKSLQNCKEISKCESYPCKDNFACIDLIDDFLCTCLPGYTGKRCKINIDDCQDQPCLNGGTCHDLVNNYTCACEQGYQGINCEDDVDECVSSPCSSNALCSNVPGGYNCQCKPGYTGTLCDTEVDECLVSPCQNGATCKDGINNYECRCTPGYQGHDCEENIDDCASNPCQNEAKCLDGIAGYHCSCLAGFKGPNCEHNIDECAHAECKHNATCVDQVNGFYCVCQEGFSGKLCEVDIDECISNPCMNEARCENRMNGYSCDCQEGFDGLHCENNIDDCASNPCSNNGSCHDSVNNFTCVCPTGFTGNTCSLDMDYCASMPCFNNASCFDGVTSFTCQCPDGFNGDQCQHNIDDCQNVRCSNGGTCIDGIDEYVCFCTPGFTGFNCEINIDECAQNPCLNEGTCTDMINDFHCTCQSGYTGRNCSVNINECLSFPCQNNATCFDKVNSYTCACVDGFIGKHCEFDIDDCLVHLCVNGAKCKDGINSYTCICPPGYSGEHCEEEVDECELFPCLFGGTCYDKINGFYCGCQNGFAGQRCEVNIDECQSKPCANNGTCTDLVADYTCWCPSGYTGVHCENRIDYCKDVNCSQNGVCENLLEGFRCICSSGYFGKYCEFDLDECFVGPCFNNATCHDAIDSFTCSCTAGFTGRFCELNIDDCFNNSCQNNATCIDHTLGYSCLCADGYNGTYCQTEINECESDPCKNNGTCEDQTPGYKCKCLDNYTGGKCENLRDFCVPSPCENGGSCLADNSTGTVSCLCKTGFTGRACDVNIDDCASEPCMPNSYCDDLVNGYECKCYPTYTGDHCDVFLGTNFDLIFKRQNSSDMVIISDGENIPTMRSFTIVMFVRADSKYKSGTLFSYSVPNDANDTIILSYSKSHVEIKIKDETVKVNFELADDHWHYVGVVWNGITGTVSVYIDGPEIEKKVNVLTSDTISGGGWIVLGQRYLAGQNSSLLSTAFVGTLHQVNFWNVPGTPDHMWMAAHNCTWPIAGTTRGWTSFLFGIKGNVEKRFMTQCKASDKCTRNCSHFLDCWSTHGLYYCNCQAGFTGPHCNIDIDECTLSPCVNGKCVDGISRYDCVCDKGYWGTNCEKKIDNEGECPPLSDPKNGVKSCKNFSGRMDCTMTCDEGHTYDSEAMTSFECGPDTGWKWNHMDHVNVPACSSKAAPKEIRHRLLLGFRGMECQSGNGFSSFRTAIEQTITDTLSEIPGCLYTDTCKLKEVEVPGCGWTADQKKKKKREVTNGKDVLLSLSVKAVDSPKLTDDVEEKSEAVLFQMQYAVSTGKFKVILHGLNSTADRSSLKHLSSDITCNPGFVTSSDRKGCVACSVGTSFSQEFSTCTWCSRGTYQDEEGQLSCKPCGEGRTTYDFGADSRDECFVEKENL